MKANGYHGNDKNEFKVYDARALGSTKNFDPKSMTFVPMKAFCSNSVQVRTEGDHAVGKCLEHDVGQQDVMHPWIIT